MADFNPGMQTMRGTVGMFSRTHPILSPAVIKSLGMRFGKYEDGQPWYFDPRQLQRDGVIGAPIIITYADKNHGKTTKAKVMGARLTTISWGPLGRAPRLAIDVTRVNDQESEWLDIARALGMNNGPRKVDELLLNPYGQRIALPFPRLTWWQKFALEYESTPLSIHEEGVLNAALWRMLVAQPAERPGIAASQKPGYGLLAELIAEINAEQIRLYQGTAMGVTNLHTFLPPVDESELARSISTLLFRLSRYMMGGHDHVFGDGVEIDELLDVPAQILDFGGLSQHTRPVVTTLFDEIRDYSAERGDNRYSAEYIILDETNKTLRDPAAVDRMLSNMKTIRGKRRIMDISVHRPKDLRLIGAENSAHRNSVTSIPDEADIAFMGRMSSKSGREELADMYELPNMVRDDLANLEVGWWWLKIGGFPARKVKLDLMERELGYSFSNQANTETARTRSDVDEEE